MVGAPSVTSSPPTTRTSPNWTISPGSPLTFSTLITSSAATRYCLPPVRMTANIVLVLVFDSGARIVPDRLLSVGCWVSYGAQRAVTKGAELGSPAPRASLWRPGPELSRKQGYFGPYRRSTALPLCRSVIFAENRYAFSGSCCRCANPAADAEQTEETMRLGSLTFAIAAALLPAPAPAPGVPLATGPVRRALRPGRGTTDTMARLIGQKLEQRLGKPFVAENRPGAGTVIAASLVAKAPPDGHTLMLATSTTMAINVSVHKSLAIRSDPWDLTPVALIAGVPFLLAVIRAIPVRSIADLIAFAKAEAGASPTRRTAMAERAISMPSC